MTAQRSPGPFSATDVSAPRLHQLRDESVTVARRCLAGRFAIAESAELATESNSAGSRRRHSQCRLAVA